MKSQNNFVETYDVSRDKPDKKNSEIARNRGGFILLPGTAISAIGVLASAAIWRHKEEAELLTTFYQRSVGALSTHTS